MNKKIVIYSKTRCNEMDPCLSFETVVGLMISTCIEKVQSEVKIRF